MKATLKLDIVREATRLTRAGQLVEATILLQRTLRGETEPDTISGTTERIALTGRKPPNIDAKADTIEGTDGPPSPARNPTGHARKIFGTAGMDEKLKTQKGRYIVAVQVYSILFGADVFDYIPPPNIPTPIY